MPLWKYIAIVGYIITIGGCIAVWILSDSIIPAIGTTFMALVLSMILYKAFFVDEQEAASSDSDD